MGFTFRGLVSRLSVVFSVEGVEGFMWLVSGDSQGALVFGSCGICGGGKLIFTNYHFYLCQSGCPKSLLDGEWSSSSICVHLFQS